MYIYIASQSSQSIQISQITFRNNVPFVPQVWVGKWSVIQPWSLECPAVVVARVASSCSSTASPSAGAAPQTPSGPTQQRATCQMGRWGFGEIPRNPKSEFETSRSSPYKSPNTTPLSDFCDAKFPKQYLSRVFAKLSYPGLKKTIHRPWTLGSPNSGKHVIFVPFVAILHLWARSSRWHMMAHLFEHASCINRQVPRGRRLGLRAVSWWEQTFSILATTSQGP